MSNPTDNFRDRHAALRALIEETVERFFREEQERGTGRFPARVRARATQHVTNRAQGKSLNAINKYELASIRSLLVWAANEQKAAPETVEAITEARFGVESVNDLPRREYDEVIQFLIDLRIDEMKN